MQKQKLIFANAVLMACGYVIIVMGVFVVSVDGPDFSGKTTVSNLLVEELRKRLPEQIIKKSEVPSSLVTGAFTKILRNSSDSVDPRVFALTYAADHLHHYNAVVKRLETASESYILVQERSLLSSIIYQGLLGDVDMDWLLEINKYDLNIPHLQIILKIDINEILERKSVEKRDFDKFETASSLEAQARVYYDLDPELSRKFNVKLIDIDSGRDAQAIACECADVVEAELKKANARN